MSLNQTAAPVICTIVAQNYLAHARTLTDSFLAQHPQGKVYVLSVDGWKDDAAREKFTRVEVRQLNIARFHQMAFRYNVTELATAVKPFFLQYLLTRHPSERVLYFDPDIYFYQSIAPLWKTLDTHDIVLTPHLLQPLSPGAAPSELDILKSGVYNLGFIGVRSSASVETLLTWWGKRLERECLHDTARGYFVDQRWADLIPSFCERTHIWRDETYNVAYWNLSQRKLACENGTWRVNGKLLTFYHFSGYKPEAPTQLSIHFKRAIPSDMPTLSALASEYAERLHAHGYTRVKTIPYGLARFENGTPIPASARRLWHDMHGERHWAQPFRVDNAKSFFAWLNSDESVKAPDAPLVTNLALELYRLRLDVQALWREPLGADRRAFAHWFLNTGAREHELDDAFVEPMRASFQALVTEPDALSDPYGEPRASTYVPSPTLKRRVYYAIRNPLRRVGLHRVVRAVLGEPMTDQLHNSMVLDSARHPMHDGNSR